MNLFRRKVNILNILDGAWDNNVKHITITYKKKLMIDIEMKENIIEIEK